MRSLLTLALAPWMSGCLSFHTGPLPGEPADATFTTLEGTRVRYLDDGPSRGRRPGVAVVLVHGFASSIEAWTGVIPVLREKHRVLALDLRGFGWTDRPPGDYSPEAQARLVLALMDQRGIDRAAVVGHSYGASVALQMALAAPRRVARLALYDAWVYSSQLPPFFHMARADGIGEALFAVWYGERAQDRIALAFHDRSFVTRTRVDEVNRALARPGTHAAALAAVRSMRYEHSEWRYREIDVPSLLLWGAEDRITPLGVGERLAGDLPRSRLVVFPSCGHFPMIEQAPRSTAVLARFLETGRAPAAGLGSGSDTGL